MHFHFMPRMLLSTHHTLLLNFPIFHEYAIPAKSRQINLRIFPGYQVQA